MRKTNLMKQEIARGKMRATLIEGHKSGRLKLTGVAQKGNLNYTNIYGNPFKGKKHSEKTKLKMSKLKLGIPSPFKGKTFEEMHGKEKAEELKKGIIENNKKLCKESKFGFQKGNKYWNNSIAKKTRFKKGHSWSVETKLKMVKAQRKSLRLKPNKPEKIIINLIQQNNLNFIYVGDGKKWIKDETNIFNPDFIHKEKKMIIEMFGDYWHNRSEVKERDMRRLKTYLSKGYETLIIWEKELEKPLQVLNKIQNFNNGGKSKW